MLLAMENATTTEISNETAVAARLILLLRIVHQVLLSNCPTVAAAATAGVEGDADKWAKSSQLRSRLGEIAILPLWKALATSFQKLNQEMQEQYQNEVKGMMEEWREHNVFGGPTVWEEYKRGWGRALKEVGDAGSRGEGGESTDVGAAEDATTTTEPVVDDAKKELVVEAQQSTVSKESSQKEETENVIEDPVIEKRETKDESDVVVETVPVSLVVEESGEGKVARATKRDSVASASVDVEVDFEVRRGKVFFLFYSTALLIVQLWHLAVILESISYSFRMMMSTLCSRESKKPEWNHPNSSMPAKSSPPYKSHVISEATPP